MVWTKPALGALLLAIVGGCGGEGQDGGPMGSGLGFEHVHDRLDFDNQSDGGDGKHGAAWFDLDDDGHLDLFLTNGKGHPNALFRNRGDGTFEDIAASAGVENGLGNMGVVAGDLDNDGDADLILTGDGGYFDEIDQSPMRIYVNQGDRTFVESSRAAGMLGPVTASGVSLADLDDDGFLDVFICSNPTFNTGAGKTPTLFNQNALYRNDGDLTFTDVSAASGTDVARGALVAVFSDYDDDGLPDLFVANDASNPIQLFHNDGGLVFTDVSATALDGRLGDWMGLSFADVDRDGDLDFFATNDGARVHALYENVGVGRYVDAGERLGVAAWEFAFGTSFADFDNDGDPDLVMTGSLPTSARIGPGLGNPTRFLRNDDGESFTELHEQLGLVDTSSFQTSGLAQGDFDGDGFPDFVVPTSTLPGASGRPYLYRNQGNGHHWITLRTVGTTSNRDGVGARIVVTSGDLVQVKERYAGSSFLSMDSPWLTFGLGERTVVDRVEVRWPSGLVETFAVAIDRLTVLTEGEGE